MGFFDLNIPYDPSSKSSGLKLVIKAMELGYSGVAFNRTIKTTLSDLDRCSITLYSVPRLLALDPSLASSVSFHRNLLSVPRTVTFRQYTRLTLAFDGPSQASLLTGGNAVLKSYDIVAVQPLTQTAFDYACQTAEVDIISIDFEEKLPFRLKTPMVKAAIKRGVYFEIRYSSLITDVQARTQILPSAKLLVDWSQGQNLIISSAALSVNEFRGPYDVANLLSLLGLSMERAKEAISKNCRNLITCALRKKHFYKETIRIRPISTDKNSDMKESLALDSSKWDPISSAEGDLQLDDLAQSFLVTNKASKTVKTTELASLTGGCQSHDNFFLAGTKPNKVPVVNFGVIKKSRCRDLVAGKSQKAAMVIDLNSVGVADGKLDISSENLMFQKPVIDAESKTVSTADAKVNILAGNVNLLSPHKQISSEKTPVTHNVLGRGNNEKSEDHALSDHISFHVTADYMKSDASLFSNCKNYGEEAMQEEKHGDAASEPTLPLGNARIPVMASSDDKIGSTANCEILCGVALEKHDQDLDTEKVFVLEGDPTVADNPSAASHASLEKVKEEQEHRDIGTESILVLDDYSNVKVKGRRKWKKHCQLPPSNNLEEQGHEDVDTNSIPILDDDPNLKDKDNFLVPSSPVKAGRKRKRNRQPHLSPLKHLEELRHEDVDTSSIAILDGDLNVKGKAVAKHRRHKKNLSPSKHLEEKQHSHIDAESIPDLDGDSNVKDNSTFPSSKGKAEEKNRRHKKNLSPYKHLEEQQHAHIEAESIPDLDGDSNVKDNSSIQSSKAKAKAKHKRRRISLSPSKHFEE